METKKAKALQGIEQKKENLIALSNAIWDHPEIRYTEYGSMELLCRFLEKEGFTVEKGIANIPTAFRATFGSGHPFMGFLGEYDALDGLSQKPGITHPEALVPGGKGHGCGHNLLGTGCVAAAMGVKAYLEENHLPGTVIFFGCPAEEGGSGKSFMARDGVFDGLDMAFSWHPEAWNEVLVGGSLANHQVLYEFYGKASHASGAPEKGRSALDAVQLMDTGVEYLREHMIDTARIHYAILDAGGKSPNVVPPFASVLYLIRAPRNEQVQELNNRVDEIAQGAALMTRTRVEKKFIKACSSLMDNTVMEEALQKNLEGIEREAYTPEELELAHALSVSAGGQKMDLEKLLENYDRSHRMEVRKLLAPYAKATVNDFIMPLKDRENMLKASTDVGDVSWICPCAIFTVATWPAGVTPHTWQAVSLGKSTFAQKGMFFAGKVMAGTAIDFLEHPEMLENAKEELKSRVGEQGYVAPIPADVKPQIPEKH